MVKTSNITKKAEIKSDSKKAISTKKPNSTIRTAVGKAPTTVVVDTILTTQPIADLKKKKLKKSNKKKTPKAGTQKIVTSNQAEGSKKKRKGGKRGGKKVKASKKNVKK